MADLILALQDLCDEIGRAREKFPSNLMLFEALMEEVCEGANGHMDGKAGNPEWLQVACVAMRMYTEGCPGVEDSGLRMKVGAMERLSRRSLGGVAKPPYHCVGCKRPAKGIDEYRALSRDENTPYATADEAVAHDEGTFNPTHGTFYCTDCYLEAGQPLGLAPAMPA